jgi:beta-glucanase (GH16 family)
VSTAEASHAGLRLVWSDEFDGPAGAPVDAAVWTHEVGDGSARGIPGWGNNELQCYRSGTENAALNGRGNLAITVEREPAESRLRCYYGRCRFTSARIVTKGKLEVRYGRIEARMRVPRGAGLWPAVWALGADIDDVPWPACGEIDVMEHVGREPRRVYGTIHGPGYSGEHGLGGTIDLPQDVAGDFHLFAVDWQPGRILWSVDGTVYQQAGPHDAAPHEWVFDRPFFLLVNLAVGGDFGGPVGDATEFPQRLLVDYVRVYER